MDCEKIWSVNDIVRNRNNWSLLADSELLKHLQCSSKNIIDKSKSTLELLESFENEVDQTYLFVSNVNNRFKSLSDTQFIENKVYESLETEAIVSKETKEFRNKNVENVTNKLKEALNNGLTVLSSHYDIITVSDSDSENEEPQEILLKSCNPFMKRRLPYIIGTDNFTKYDHLGLVDLSFDEEEEDESTEEVIREEQSYDRLDVSSGNYVKSTVPAQIIQISSSDSDDSDASSRINSRRQPIQVSTSIINDSVERKQCQPFPKVPHSLADHLSATLLEVDKRPSDIPDCNDPFSPPPFPVNSNISFSSDEEKSDSGETISSNSPVILHSSLSSSQPLSQTASNTNYYDTLKNGVINDSTLNDSSISKSVKYGECAESMTSDQINDTSEFSIFDQNPELTSSTDNCEEKKLSKALADEFKSTVLARRNSTLRSCRSTECISKDSVSSTCWSTGKSENVTIEKILPICEPCHNPPILGGMGHDNNDNDNSFNRVDSSKQESCKTALVSSAATKSRKISHIYNKDDNDDDDDDESDDESDDWFNRAVSSNISRNIESGTATASTFSQFSSLKNLNKRKETVVNVFCSDSKTTIDGSLVSGDKESAGVVSQSGKSISKVDKGKKSYSLIRSDDDDDNDDDYLFKKASPVSDKNKTNELYEILFNDSDTDDPIQALVEENKRSAENISTKSKIFDDSKTVNILTKDFDTPDKNYLSPRIWDDEYKPSIMQLIVSSGKETTDLENKSVAATKVSGLTFTSPTPHVNYETESKPSLVDVTENYENILSQKIVTQAEAEIMSSRDAVVFDINCKYDQVGKIPRNNDQIFGFDDANKISAIFLESAQSGSFSESSASTDEKSKSDLICAKKDERSKLGLDFLLSDPDKISVEAIEKKKINLENPASYSAMSVAGGENDETQRESCPLRNPDLSLESSIYKSDLKNDAPKPCIGIENQTLFEAPAVPEINNSDSHLVSSMMPQNSPDFRVQGLSKNTSEQSETTISSCPGRSFNSSTNMIYTDNASNNLTEENSCPINIVKGSSSSEKIKPGKLSAGRGKNVNITALLPNSKWPKSNAKMVKKEELTLDKNEVDISNIVSKPQPDLSSVTKDRVKAPVKRRPPTRRGRVARLNEQQFVEISVTDNVVTVPKNSNDLGLNSNSVSFCDSSAGKSTYLENTFTLHHSEIIQPLPIEATSKDTFKDISCVTNIANFEVNDTDSIFNDIFSDDGSKDCVSNALPVKINSSNQRDLFGERHEQLAKPFRRVELLPKSDEQNLFSSFENDSLTSSITNCKNANTELSKNFECSRKANSSLFRKQNKQINGVLSTIENETGKSTFSNFRSDLFADDDDDGDEDFNELFSPLKKPLKGLPLKKKSLFEDGDGDDDDLFSVKTTPLNRNESMSAKHTNSSKTEYLRTMKLRSELVLTDDDPLTLKRV